MREDPGRASETLQHCLVEMEGESLRSPRRRRVSLLLSVTLQAALLGGILLVPLLVNGEKLRATILVPSPPYYGVPRGQPQHQAPKGGPKSEPIAHPPDHDTLFQPPRIPPHAPSPDDPRITGSREGPWIGIPDGVPNGPLPPFDSQPSDRWMQKPPEIPKPPQQKQKVNVSEGVQQGKLIHRVDPVYPVLARPIHLQGTVRLRAVIGRDGTVRELELLSGHPLLAQAALAAVQQWRYQPTLLNGQPVEVETLITVVFILR